MIRNPEIIDEPCRTLPQEIRKKHPVIEWRKIVEFKSDPSVFGWRMWRCEKLLKIKDNMIKEIKSDLDASTI